MSFHDSAVIPTLCQKQSSWPLLLNVTVCDEIPYLWVLRFIFIFAQAQPVFSYRRHLTQTGSAHLLHHPNKSALLSALISDWLSPLSIMRCAASMDNDWIVMFPSWTRPVPVLSLLFSQIRNKISKKHTYSVLIVISSWCMSPYNKSQKLKLKL